MREQPDESWKFEPSAEALTLVPEMMARTYSVLPLSYDDHDRILSIAADLSVGTIEKALDDLRRFLGIEQVKIVTSLTREQIHRVLDRCYTQVGEDMFMEISDTERNDVLQMGPVDSIDSGVMLAEFVDLPELMARKMRVCD